MTPQPAAAHLTVDPATIDATVATIFGTLRRDQRDVGAELIAALRPRNPVEATYAVRAAAAHYGSVECFRRTMLPDTPDNAGIRWAGKAVAMSHLSMEMLHALQQCQAATPRAQPQAQPATPPAVPTMPPMPAMPAVPPRPAVPAPAAPATAAGPEAAGSAKPVGGQAPMSAGRQDPMSSERPSPAPAAVPATARPAAPPSPTPATPARPETAVPANPADGQAPMSAGKPDPMPSERPSPTPITFRLKGWPAPVAFPFKAPPVTAALFRPAPADPLLAAPPPRQGRRAALLGSTGLASAVVAAAIVQAAPPCPVRTPGRCATAIRAAIHMPLHEEPARGRPCPRALVPGVDPRGAHTRAGCPCRQPAMRNGRCPPGQARGQAQHGGRSTGPRTEAGRAVLAAARTKHGHYGAEARTFVAAIDALLRGVPKQPARGRGTP